MKPTFNKEKDDVSSDNMVAVEVNNGYIPEYLMNLDKVNHKDDIIMFLLFGGFILVNILVGLLAPPSASVLNKEIPVIVDAQDSFSIYEMGIESISSMNSYVKMGIRYITDHYANISTTLLVNVSMKFTNPKSDHSKRSFMSSNVTFNIIPGTMHTNTHIIYFERMVDYSQVSAEVSVFGNEQGLRTLEFTATLGSFSDAQVQIWIRIVYTIILVIVYRIFNNRMKTVEVRHEQSLTSGLIFATCFLNNPTIIVNYIRPTLAVTLFDTILRSFYTGFLALFVFVVLGHCGIKEKMMGDFITNRLSIAASVGLLMITREFTLDLAQIYNPMFQITNVDFYLKAAEYVLLCFIIIGVIRETVLSVKRIDEAERFRLLIYVIAASISIFLLASTMGLIGEKTTLKFLATFGAANALSFAMTYAHYPYSIDNIEYKDAQSADIASMSDVEDIGLIDDEVHKDLGKEQQEIEIADDQEPEDTEKDKEIQTPESDAA